MSIEQLATELWDIVLDHHHGDAPVKVKFERRLAEVLVPALRDADLLIVRQHSESDEPDWYLVNTVLESLRAIYEEHGRILS